MPATDYQSRSFLNLRSSGQVHSMESNPQELELQSFQRQVADRFHDLSAVSPDELLSLGWIRNLLDAFLSCQEDFRVLILNNKEFLNKPPMEKMASEYFDRSVKALDVCNAIRDGIEQIRLWQKQLEIVLCALDNRKYPTPATIGEGHFRRAKKALVDLAIGMLDEKESTSALAAHRNRSFGRNKESNSNGKNSLSQFRSLSWSVSRSWSANKQLQAIGTNLTPPKSNEILATNGLAVSVYTMNSVLLFVMWAIVAAIPCQDRGLQTHFNIPKQFNWAGPILSLHERILEESKKKDRKNACGLMKEIHEIEICARHMNELTDSVTFPLSKEKEEDVKQKVGEVRVVFEGLKEGLDPLEKQMREVFHRIVRSRTEGLDSFGRR